MITLQDNTFSALVKLADGKLGAATVLAEVAKDPLGFVYLCHADDMGMKGASVWVAYKDFAKRDIQKFKDALQDRDAEMIRVCCEEGYPIHAGGRS